MGPTTRRIALVAHVSFSVGWLGAVAAFLVLTIVGMTSNDVDVVRSVYVTLEVSGWFVLIPFATASLVTGLVQGLGTRWGLLRHYWVVFKLVINVGAALVLLAYMQTLEHFADLAEDAVTVDDLDALKSPSPMLHSGAALVLLLVAATLGVVKPRGVTPFGRRRRSAGE